MDETITYTSRRLQKFESCIVNQEESSTDNFLVDEFINYYITQVDENGVERKEKNKECLIIGRGGNFTFYYAMLLKNIALVDGFDALLEKGLNLFKGGNETEKDLVNTTSNVDKEKDELKDIPTDFLYMIFTIFEITSNYFHKNYILEIGEKLFLLGKSFLNKINKLGIKNIKKDLLDIILKVLKNYDGRIKRIKLKEKKDSIKLEDKEVKLEDDSEVNTKLTNLSLSENKETDNLNSLSSFQFDFDEIEQLALACNLRFLKIGSLDKRIQSVKSLVDYIKSSYTDKEKLEKAYIKVEEYKIIDEIFGANSHSQLVIKSQDLLEILIKEDKLKENELQLVLSFLSKGDLEGKLMILKMLKDICKNMNAKHISTILNLIYKNDPSSLNILKEEIDVSDSFFKIYN